jgi:hypothetical protein
VGGFTEGGVAVIGRRRGGGWPSAFNGRIEGVSMAGLKAPVSGTKEGEWGRLMGGNEGEIDAAVFLLRWKCRGDYGGGVRPAGGGAVLGFGAGGRR